MLFCLPFTSLMLIFLLTAASTLADSSATSAQLPHLQAAKLPKLQSHEQKDVPSKKEVVLVRRKRLTSFTHFAQRVILVSLLELAKRTAKKKVLPAMRRLLLKGLLVLGFASAGVIIGGGSLRLSKRFSPVLVNVTRTPSTPRSPKDVKPVTGFRGFRRTLFLAIDEHASVLLGLFVLASLVSLLLGYSCLKAKRANDRRIVANAAALVAKRLRKRRAAEAAKKRKMLVELKRRRKRSTTSIWATLRTRSTAAFFSIGDRKRRRR